MAADADSRQDEIRQIEQDLSNLERRYGSLEDAVKWLKLGFGANVVALIGFAVLGVAIGNAGLVATTLALLVLCGLAALAGPVSVSAGLAWSGRGARWIDVVGWQPPGILGLGVKRSEAMAVEDMIADRRRRLAQLQARRPDQI
jgi:hypothetical protein